MRKGRKEKGERKREEKEEGKGERGPALVRV